MRYKDNLYLIVRFNKYTGNFERQFMSYVFGVTDEYDYDDRFLKEFKRDLDTYALENDLDFKNEINSVYDYCRWGRWDSEYYGYTIDPAPEGSDECDCIYIAVKEKFREEIFEKIRKRMGEFPMMLEKLDDYPHNHGVEILDVAYYKETYTRV